MNRSLNVRPATVLAALTLGTLSALLTVAGPATADDQSVNARGVTALASDTYEQRVQHWINQKREAHGLRKVRAESCTDGVAESWGRHLAETLTFYHQSMGAVMSACGATYAGETLAKGAVRPRRIVSLWMHSPGHRAILLSKYPRRVGIGAYQDSTGAWVVAADFTRF